ncbi:unnamed protein product [Phaeothamnion confervicola]
MDRRGFEQFLQKFPKVRDRDFYDVPLKNCAARPAIAAAGWSATVPAAGRRRPIAKEERAAAYQERSAAAALAPPAANDAGAGGRTDAAASAMAATLPASAESRKAVADGPATADSVARFAAVPLEGDFWKEFDAWADRQYVGNRAAATKLKVAFRKEHRMFVASLCLEDLEEICASMAQ